LLPFFSARPVLSLAHGDRQNTVQTLRRFVLHVRQNV